LREKKKVAGHELCKHTPPGGGGGRRTTWQWWWGVKNLSHSSAWQAIDKSFK
jgi:hypothetical protein